MHLNHPSIEALEARIAPASVAVNAFTKTATWTDWDGDVVTFKWTGAAAPTFVSEDAGGLTVLVDKITLTNANDALTLTVKALGNGDGHIDLGHVDATGVALKSWSSPKATIAEFDCGDNTTAIGTYLSAGIGIVPHTKFTGAGGDGINALNGSVGTFSVRGDLATGKIVIAAGAGKVGSVSFAGSIRGDTPVAGIVNGAINLTAGKLGTFTVAGSIVGGDGDGEGSVTLAAPADKVLIKGNLVGGTATSTGRVDAAAVKSFTINGNVVGGTVESSGTVRATGVTTLTLGGSLMAGGADNTGMLVVDSVTSATIKGSIIGAMDLDTVVNSPAGAFQSSGNVGSLTVWGDLIAGTQLIPATVSYNGAILIGGNIASITVKGSVLGNDDTRAYILAKGVAPLTTPNFNAIGKLVVGGDVENAYIAAGHLFNTATFDDRIGTAENPDAGIGSVTVGGNWLHSSLTAGINDAASNGFDVTDTRDAGDAARHAVIGPVVIKGDLLVNPSASGFSGFGSEKITSITVGGIKVFTTGAADRFLDFYQLVRVGEV